MVIHLHEPKSLYISILPWGSFGAIERCCCFFFVYFIEEINHTRFVDDIKEWIWLCEPISWSKLKWFFSQQKKKIRFPGSATLRWRWRMNRRKNKQTIGSISQLGIANVKEFRLIFTRCHDITFPLLSFLPLSVQSVGWLKFTYLFISLMFFFCWN